MSFTLLVELRSAPRIKLSFTFSNTNTIDKSLFIGLQSAVIKIVPIERLTANIERKDQNQHNTRTQEEVHTVKQQTIKL